MTAAASSPDDRAALRALAREIADPARATAWSAKRSP
jgi:hypothetical protein